MKFTLGFNLGFEYGSYKRINVYMNKESDLAEVKTLVDEVFDGEYKIEYTDEFSDTISIKLKDISEEKVKDIENKLEEKYTFDDNAKHIITVNIPSISVYDLVKEYITPVLLSFIISLIYFAIAYRKLGVYKSLIEPALTVILIGGVYVSLLLVCRIPLNEYIIPLGIFIYIISLLSITIALNNENKGLIVKKK